MKIISRLVLAIISPLLLSSFAPEKEFTGTIVYNITYDMENIDPQMASYLPKTMKMTVKAPFSKSEVSMGMGSNISIFNTETGTGVSLMDMMGQKLAIQVTEEDIKEEMDSAGDVEVVKLDETKEILGYTCKKAVVKVKEGDQELIVFYTDELGTGLENENNPLFKDIDGMMLEFSMNQNNMNMHFTAVNVDKRKVSDKEFETPEGYKEVSREEMQSMFGM